MQIVCRKEVLILPKVVVVTNIPTPYRKGFFEALASSQSLDLTVLYCAHNERGRSWGRQVGSGYKCRFLPGITFGTSFHLNPTLVVELVRERFDVCIVGGYSYPSVVMAILLSKLLRSTTIMWLDGPVGSKGKGLKRLIVPMASHYIVTSKRAKESLLRYGVSPSSVDIVPLTVDVNLWKDARLRISFQRERLFQDNRFSKIVLFCGRFIPAKNVGFVIELAFRLRDIKELGFVLVGDGPLKNSVLDRIRQLGLTNVVLLGFIPPEELPPIFASSEILVLPSVREQWGAVVNEALASGVPVMVSRVAGASELIDEGITGYVIDPYDIESAERILRTYLLSDTLREEMKLRAAAVGAQLTHEFAAARFVEVIRKCLDR